LSAVKLAHSSKKSFFQGTLSGNSTFPVNIGDIFLINRLYLSLPKTPALRLILLIEIPKPFNS